jgi:hypothetical protein
MPTQNIILFHPEASDEYAASYAWCYYRGAHVADIFEREVNRSLRLIVDYPRRLPVYRGKYRRIMVRRFPFSLVYAFMRSTWLLSPSFMEVSVPVIGRIVKYLMQFGESHKSTGIECD